MKYKVGDKVRILHTDYENEGLEVGVVKTVVRVGYDGVDLVGSETGPLYFYDKEVELVEEEPKVSLQAGNTYKDQRGREYTCLFVEGNNAYCVGGSGQAAYVWEADTGKAVSLSGNPDYDLHIPVVETKVGSVVFTDGTPDWNTWEEKH